MSYISVIYIRYVPVCLILVCSLHVMCLYAPTIKSPCLSAFYNHLGILFLDADLNLMVTSKRMI